MSKVLYCTSILIDKFYALFFTCVQFSFFCGKFCAFEHVMFTCLRACPDRNTFKYSPKKTHWRTERTKCEKEKGEKKKLWQITNFIVSVIQQTCDMIKLNAFTKKGEQHFIRHKSSKFSSSYRNNVKSCFIFRFWGQDKRILLLSSNADNLFKSNWLSLSKIRNLCDKFYCWLHWPVENKLWIRIRPILFSAFSLVLNVYLDERIFHIIYFHQMSTFFVFISCRLLNKCSCWRRPKNIRSHHMKITSYRNSPNKREYHKSFIFFFLCSSQFNVCALWASIHAYRSLKHLT